MFLNRTFGVGILLACCTVSFAQSKLDSIQHIDEVVIVADADRYREVIPSQRLSGEKLEALNSFSVADAIRYFSGIQIKDYGGIGGLKTVDIRSMGTHQIGVFYDGIQLGNAQNGQIDLGKFSLDNIEEISLYNGQKSEIFQSAKDFGSAGTIYLRTRRPRFEAGKKTNIQTVVRTGSFDLMNPAVLWEQKLTDHIAFNVNTEYIYSSGKYPFRYRKKWPDGTMAWDTTAVRQNGDIHSMRLEGGLHGFLENGKWNAKAYFYDSEKGIPGAIVNNVWKNSQRQWDRNFFAQASVETWHATSLQTQINVKYANDWMHYLNPDTTLMYIDNTFHQQEIYASVANKYAILPNWDVNLSVDYQWNSLDASLQNFVYPKRNTTLVALATAFEWQRIKAQASLLGTFVNESVGIVADKQEYTPAFFLSYQPFKQPDLNFRTFYKRIFRMPTFNDLYYTDIGNVNLRPEYTTQYNLGFQYNKNYNNGIVDNLNFRADAYYNEVTDKIIAVPKGNGQYRWMMMNIGYVEIRGIDISAQISWKLPAGVQVNTGLNYTYQKAQDFSNSTDNDPEAGTYGRQIAYIPWHSGSTIVNMSWKSYDLNYSFIYVGERYHNSSNIRENYEQPWYTHDLTIGKSFYGKPVKFSKLNRFKTKISVEVNNIFNQQYDVVLNYPMPGRNYKLILKMDI
ncbi:MAG: TonB-dependent receptor [Candidatus Symbiothrix sp.]|jgi:outer membrane cobalamin receptor|nr:TonB-dependent receptor [Candidatus Symbiothrix sp.]